MRKKGNLEDSMHGGRSHLSKDPNDRSFVQTTSTRANVAIANRPGAEVKLEYS